MLFITTSVLLLLIINIGVMCQQQQRSPQAFCSDLNPQHNLDMDQLMGMWFVNEIVTHLEEPTGEHYYDTCIVIHLADITEQMLSYRPTKKHRDGNTGSNSNSGSLSPVGGISNSGISFGGSSDFGGDYYNSDKTRQINQYKYLRLIWDENESNLEYTLKYNITRRGFWISSAPQKGSMTNLPYTQFGGTIQVIKAVGDHLVLTFCQRNEDQLFSLILTRRPNVLTADEIQSVRALLKRRKLSTATVRKVCSQNSNIMHKSNGFILFFIITITKLIYY